MIPLILILTLKKLYKMSETYTIHKDVINTIFNKIVASNAFFNKKNAGCANRILLKELSESTIETIIHLQLMEEEYKVLKVGDYALVKPPSYHEGTEYEEDILNDMGLLPNKLKPGYVFAEVIGDNSWSSSKKPFDPFYSQIKVNLLYHDKDRKLKLKEETVNPLYAIKFNKGRIPYFKYKTENMIDYVDTIKTEEVLKSKTLKDA
tara:strand:+ start:1155 stop:1772 length:618 start_codon:yes stop_codon:yes gene_type:complete